MSIGDNFYLFNENTVRFDQTGFLGGPANNSIVSTYQRYPDGFGINHSYNWTTSNSGGWLIQIPTLPTTNVPVELSQFDIILPKKD